MILLLKRSLVLGSLLVLLIGCDLTYEGELVTVDEFGWTVNIPQEFERQSAETVEAFSKAGLEKLDRFGGLNITKEGKQIFTYRKGKKNAINVLSQPYSIEKEGPVKKNLDALLEVLINAYMTASPDCQVQGFVTRDRIDGLRFFVMELAVKYPDNTILKSQSYTRVFGEESFTINIIYDNKQTGRLLRQVVRNSTFEQ